MKLEEIEKVIALFEKANISSLEVEDDGVKIKLTKEMTPILVSKTIPEKETALPSEKERKEEIDTKDYIKSPLVGTYHQAPFAEAKPFVEVGSKVKKGDKLCIIEAMKVMNEITADKDGTITKILCKEGDMVEYDQKLFELGA